MRARRTPSDESARPKLVALQGGRGAAPEPGYDDRGTPTPPGEPPRPRLKLKWLRVAFVAAGLTVLGGISFVFGMMMAVASDLPEIEALDVPQRPSQILDRDGKPLGLLTSNENRILVRSDQINPTMKNAVVAIEDRRFYTNSGVDIRGIGRAFVQNVIARDAVQGGSTIPQQLVKNRLNAAKDRTMFQKVREAAMAVHVTRQWDKERILRNYLNTIYYGYGAYGIESAARTYFGRSFGIGTDDPVCGSGRDEQRCAALLKPAQAALIAGVIANPTAYDPVLNPKTSRQRRNLVLLRMREQAYISQAEYSEAVASPLPTRRDIRPPSESSRFPYFTTWVRQQVVDRMGAGQAFEGGLRVRTTIDSEMQRAAEQSIVNYLGRRPGTGGTPAAALVALENDTSDVVAMVGQVPDNSEGFAKVPFNLATQGQRQPGSAFKPFILAQALEDGVSPSRSFVSEKREFCVTRGRKGGCSEAFVVNNYDDTYAGSTTLANATTFSDNSVYAQLGLEVGTKRVARMARRLGVRSPVSSNFAMTLGGLEQGISPLDMAHAYSTFANGGRLPYGTMSPGARRYDRRDQRGTPPGPNGIRSIQTYRGGDLRVARQLNGSKATNRTREARVISAGTADTVQSLLETVVTSGTGKRAALGGVRIAGKTGTTENYGDAWFVGWSPKYTVAVWVGFPDGVTPMEPPTFAYQGEPVAGGSYPAAIWGAFLRAVLSIDPDSGGEKDDDGSATEVQAPSVTAAPATGGGADSAGSAAPTPEAGSAPPAGDSAPAAPVQEAPAAPAEPAPAPAAPAAPEPPAAAAPPATGTGASSAPTG